MKRCFSPLLRPLFAAAACLLLPGCVMMLLTMGNKDISKDARFAQVLGREIRTKVEMRLYAPDNRRPDDMREIYDLSNVMSGPENRVAVVPAGHVVRFDRAVRKDGLGSSSEYLFGEITIHGRTYPMNFYLTSDVYPNAWRRMYGVFALRE
jgi:hypothetical protein